MNALRNKLNKGPDAMLCHSCRLLAHNGAEPLPPTPMTSLFAETRCPVCDPRGDMHGVAPLPELDARRQFWYANGESSGESIDADLAMSSDEVQVLVERDEGKESTTIPTAENGKDKKTRRRGVLARFGRGKGKSKGKESSVGENAPQDDMVVVEKEEEEEEGETDPNPPAVLKLNLPPNAVADAIAAAAAESSSSSESDEWVRSDDGEQSDSWVKSDDGENSDSWVTSGAAVTSDVEEENVFVMVHDSDSEDQPSIRCEMAAEHEGEPLPGLFRDVGYLSPPLAAEISGAEASPFVRDDASRKR